MSEEAGCLWLCTECAVSNDIELTTSLSGNADNSSNSSYPMEGKEASLVVSPKAGLRRNPQERQPAFTPQQEHLAGVPLELSALSSPLETYFHTSCRAQ